MKIAFPTEPSTTVYTKGVSPYTFIVPVPTSRGMRVTSAQDSSGSSIDLNDDNQVQLPPFPRSLFSFFCLSQCNSVNIGSLKQLSLLYNSIFTRGSNQ